MVLEVTLNFHSEINSINYSVVGSNSINFSVRISMNFREVLDFQLNETTIEEKQIWVDPKNSQKNAVNSRVSIGDGFRDVKDTVSGFVFSTLVENVQNDLQNAIYFRILDVANRIEHI